jgi:putative tryptophan/tyrosine transport system substrate-binding protein
MSRREFIAGLGGAVAWPLAARAQQPDRVRRIAVLMALDESLPESKAQFLEFMKRLQELGWTERRNLWTAVRWAFGDADRMKMFAKELVDLQPELIFTGGTATAVALQRETQTIPIVFVAVGDPVGSGLVASVARPGGNATGFTNPEASMAGKWLELLTQIAPGVKTAAIIFSPETAPRGGSFFLPTFEAAARSFQVGCIVAPVHSDAEIEAVVTSLGREPGGVLIIMPDPFMAVHYPTIISLAAQHKVPAIHWVSNYVRDGGLLSYGPEYLDMYRRGASYVDRILRGAKPDDLPVQLPVKLQLAVNAKTAKALGLNVPPSILLLADEVID